MSSAESTPLVPEPAAHLLLPSEVWNVRWHAEVLSNPSSFPVSERILPHTVPTSSARSANCDDSTLFSDMKLVANSSEARWNVYVAAHLAAVVTAREFFERPTVIYEVCDLPLDFAIDIDAAGRYIAHSEVRESGVGYSSKTGGALRESMRDFLGAISFTSRGVDIGFPNFGRSVELFASRREEAHQTDFFIDPDFVGDKLAVVASRQDADKCTTSFVASTVCLDEAENILGKDLMTPLRTQTDSSFDVCLRGLLDKKTVSAVSRLTGQAAFLRTLAMD